MHVGGTVSEMALYYEKLQGHNQSVHLIDHRGFFIQLSRKQYRLICIFFKKLNDYL